MRTHPNCKIESIASKDRTRAAICNPWIDTDNGKLIATNGMAMAVIPVEIEPGDSPGHVPCEAFKSARKGARGEFSMLCNDKVELPGGSTLPRDTSEMPPKWQAVMPASDRPVLCKIRLNAQMLAKLADAMGCDSVEIEIEDDSSPLLIRPTWSGTLGSLPPACPEAVGILMPIRAR